LDDLDSGLTARVVISGADKLIAWPERSELFDLKVDPDDRHDLSAMHPEKVESLSAQLEEWFRRTSE
jgi:hypothetical protein